MAAQKIYRSDSDKIISGLCGGLGEYFDIDSTVVRIIFIILALWGGIGIILYIIGVLLISQRSGTNTERDNGRRVGEDLKERVGAVASEIRENLRANPSRGRLRGDYIFGLVFVIIGSLFLLNNLFPWFGFDLFWPVFLILIGLLILTGGLKRRNK